MKCNAHILLAPDVAIDKVFRDTETLIGVSKLIEQGASHVFSNNSKSIWYLGLIAIAKLLSPSHNKESISLYSEYTEFLKRKSDKGDPEATKLLKSQFKGFNLESIWSSG